MHVFEVLSRTVQPTGLPKKRPTRVRRLWYAVLQRAAAAGLIIFPLALLLGKIGIFDLFFFLLPVLVSIINALFQHYNRKMLLLTTILALIYFGSVIGWELLTHGPDTREYVVVTTTLALAVLFEPVRNWIQNFIEQLFHLREDKAVKAVEAFTSTLREEIDLDKVRDGLFDVVQQTMQPQAVSIWARKAVQHDMDHREAGEGENGRQRQPERRNQERQETTVASLYGASPLEVTVADSDPIIAYALGHPGTVEVDRLQLDSPALHILQANEVEIALPLASQGELIGLLTLGPRLNWEEYVREDRNLLNTLAAQVAPALRVAQMVQEQQVQVREHERIEQELRTARAIQRAFLPEALPLLAGWSLATYYQPARAVGGDFYDFIPFEDGRLGLVIGDATDKGMPAALVMTTTATMLRTAAQTTASPGEVLARVNDLLYARIPSRMFVTCFYALLDPKSGRLCYANAGQDLPFRNRSDGVSELWATGMPLGMMPGSRYEEREVTIAPGESLLFYSDGLVEAHNPRGEMFDTPRLKALLEARANGASLIDLVLSELKHFTGEEWEQEDDVTLVTLQRDYQR